MTRLKDAQDARRRREHPVSGDPSLLQEHPIVRPYGDTTGDGMVQVSFTLPLPHDISHAAGPAAGWLKLLV